jgi:hypothetical protein
MVFLLLFLFLWKITGLQCLHYESFVEIFFAVGLGGGWYDFVILQTNFLCVIIAVYVTQ